MYIREIFRTPRAFIPPTACSTSAASVRILTANTDYVAAVTSSDFVKNTEVTLTCLTGDIHISTLTTAPTTGSYKLTSGDVLSLNVPDYLAMVSTSTSATFEAIIWK